MHLRGPRASPAVLSSHSSLDAPLWPVTRIRRGMKWPTLGGRARRRPRPSRDQCPPQRTRSRRVRHAPFIIYPVRKENWTSAPGRLYDYVILTGLRTAPQGTVNKDPMGRGQVLPLRRGGIADQLRRAHVARLLVRRPTPRFVRDAVSTPRDKRSGRTMLSSRGCR